MDDPPCDFFFIYKFRNTFHTRLGAWWRKRGKGGERENKQQCSKYKTKQNTSMKSKLCCKNSMLWEFICRLRRRSGAGGKKLLALFTFEKFMSLFSEFSPRLVSARKIHLCFLPASTMDKVYMMNGENLMQSVWTGFASQRKAKNCIWHWTGRESFLTTLMHVKLAHNWSAFYIAATINLTERIYYIMQKAFIKTASVGVENLRCLFLQLRS